MVEYTPPYAEYEFLFNEVFDVYDSVSGIDHEEFDADFVRMIMEGWGEYCTEVLLPLNQIGDREGLTFEAGEVTMPTGFVDAWKEGVEAGWFATICKPEHGAVLENVSPTGEIIDHFDGRLLNPGHAIEMAWFILHEARQRKDDPRLVKLGVSMLDWMWERGWDQEYGGLYSFCDLQGLPPQELVHQMKYWWPHNEAIIATLLAYRLTGEEYQAERFKQVHAWAHEHFADPEYGEWFGYLNRDGTRSTDLKGNHWKGPFHLPRMQWYVSRLSSAVDDPHQPR